MDNAADSEGPGEADEEIRDGARGDGEEHGRIEQHRQLELVFEVVADILSARAVVALLSSLDRGGDLFVLQLLTNAQRGHDEQNEKGEGYLNEQGG